MYELQPVTKEIAHLIASVEDRTNSYMDRVRVIFTNGYSLSIIRGDGSYGGPEGLFEIAPLHPNGESGGDLFDEQDQGDDVLGYCGLERINHYMRKLAYLKPE